MVKFKRLRNGSLQFRFSLTLRPGRDDDLIDLIQRAPPRRLARTIREAMRDGVRETAPVTDDEEELDLTGLEMEL